jgi:hypothetical protein
MSAQILTQWLEAVRNAADDELDGIVKDGLSAATEVKDREAFTAIRAAGQKRKVAA